MTAERRLLEKPRHKLVTFDLVYILLSQRPSSLNAESGHGNWLGLGTVGVVANRGRVFGAVRVGVFVSHVCELIAVTRRRRHAEQLTGRVTAPAAAIAAAAAVANWVWSSL